MDISRLKAWLCIACAALSYGDVDRAGLILMATDGLVGGFDEVQRVRQSVTSGSREAPRTPLLSPWAAGTNLVSI